MGKTKLEIIDEAVRYYSVGNRRAALEATDGGACEYKTDDGRMCAVGRCLRHPAEGYQYDGTIREIHFADCGGDQTRFDAMFLPRYQGHSVEFWADLQLLHDTMDYWPSEGAGITEAGYDKAANLKKKWGKR